MKNPRFTIRAHHGMCMAYYRGKGYSREFCDNMQQTIDYLNKNNPFIRIIDRTDDICAHCPNNHGGICNVPDKVQGYDRGVLKLCSIKSGDVIRYSDFRDAVEKNILSCNRRKEICGSCQWNEICH